MILYVKVTNFRGIEGRFDFQDVATGTIAPRVQLSGRNGVRKSTIREAIAFVFTGRDSAGSTKPTHFITRGEEECEVEVQTRKGTILRRTLGEKGSCLKICLPGQGTQELTQARFEDLLCPADVFLSVFVPGYLLGQLTKNRQSAVLSYILPPSDRRELVARITGIPTEQTMGLDYSKRPDILRKQVTERRNLLDFQVATKRGEEAAILQKLDSPPSEPQPPPELALVGLQEQLQREWAQYEFEMTRYTSALHDLRIKRDENVRIRREREQAEGELKELRELPLPKEPELFTLEKPERPLAPLLQSEEERDRCPACGQAVGLKHRQMVKAQNETRLAAYQESVVAWEKEMALYAEARILHANKSGACQNQLREMKAANERVRIQREKLERQLRSQLIPHKIPETDPQPPEKPREEFSMERYLGMRQVVEKYHRALGAFDSWREAAATAKIRLRDLSAQIAEAEHEIQYLQAHVEAFRMIPGIELMEQKSHLLMPAGYELRVDDGIELFDHHGCPYDLLSRGQRMHADFLVCLKVNTLLQRKVGMVFLDDFDLADWSEQLKEAPDTVQIFTAHVREGELTVGLSN